MAVLIALALCLLGLLKWRTTGGAIMWLRRHGRDYRERIRECPAEDRTGERIRDILESCGGHQVRPWGVLDYRLHGHSKLLRLFAGILYRLPTLAALALLGFVCSYQTGSETSSLAWSAVATIYQINVVLMAVEGVYAYIAIGGYRRYYHVGVRLPGWRYADLKDQMYELDVILPLVFSVVIVNILAFMVSHVAWGSFISPSNALDTLPTWNLALDALYYLVAGDSTIAPVNAWGKVVSVLMRAQGLFVVLGMFSSLLSFGVLSKK